MKIPAWLELGLGFLLMWALSTPLWAAITACVLLIRYRGISKFKAAAALSLLALVCGAGVPAVPFERILVSFTPDLAGTHFQFFFLACTLLLSGALLLQRRFVLRIGFAHVLLFNLGLFAVLSIGGWKNHLTLWTWVLTATLGYNLWLFSYQWVDLRKGALPDSVALLLYPIWGTAGLVLGKGVSYLRSIEARSAQELRECQRSGVRLLALGFAWWCVYRLFVATFYSESLFTWGESTYFTPWGIYLPDLRSAYIWPGAEPPLSVPERWGALIADFAESSLALTVAGHQAVGVIRLLGFRSFRNTYQPFLATSVAEFWARYNFYFKELLVDFFYTPTFNRLRIRDERVRTVCAVFASAGVGNFIFYWLRKGDIIALKGLFGSLAYMSSYAIYCLGLSVALSLSSLSPWKKKKWKKKEEDTWVILWLKRITVTMFFCLLNLFSATNVTGNLQDQLGFLRSLVPVRSTSNR